MTPLQIERSIFKSIFRTQNHQLNSLWSLRISNKLSSTENQSLQGIISVSQQLQINSRER